MSFWKYVMATPKGGEKPPSFLSFVHSAQCFGVLGAFGGLSVTASTTPITPPTWAQPDQGIRGGLVRAHYLSPDLPCLPLCKCAQSLVESE